MPIELEKNTQEDPLHKPNAFQDIHLAQDLKLVLPELNDKCEPQAIVYNMRIDNRKAVAFRKYLYAMNVNNETYSGHILKKNLK